jgi:AraC family transcriptional regulator, regulatory protein of adaptative response / DNA-3-methyladenine glycosylase II
VIHLETCAKITQHSIRIFFSFEKKRLNNSKGWTEDDLGHRLGCKALQVILGHSEQNDESLSVLRSLMIRYQRSRPKTASLSLAQGLSFLQYCLYKVMKDFYEALLARDYRFDGKFFVAVKTTGVYCRPICPARPKRENVEFFADAASAEAAGYRPCLRCRPECAPLSPAWFGKKAVVQRALKLIADNALHHTNEEDFAERLGVSARHLRRLFEEEIGQTPKQISDANRLNFARKLIVETRMPMLTVARTAGFSSLRRFNDAFRERFQRAPSQLRKARSKAETTDGIELKLSFRPPYDWQTLIRFYQSHPIPGIERVTENCFERVFRIDGTIGFLRVQPVVDTPQLKLSVVTEDPRLLFGVVNRVRRMFDLDSDPILITNSFSRVPLLAKLIDRFPGLRLPGGWDPFETAVCAILGQLVSAEQRTHLIGQLVRGYGEKIVHPLSGERSYLFPAPEVLARSELDEVKTTVARREAIRDFSRRVVSGVIFLSDAQDPLAFRKAILGTRGLGSWSAEYISLRSIGDTDAFPRTDLILKRVLELHPDLDLEAVKPWRSYAAMYFWKAFAHTLSKQKRRNQHDSILQRNEVAGRQAHVSGEHRSLGGRSVGGGASGADKARHAEIRAESPDPA